MHVPVGTRAMFRNGWVPATMRAWSDARKSDLIRKGAAVPFQDRSAQEPGADGYTELMPGPLAPANQEVIGSASIPIGAIGICL